MSFVLVSKAHMSAWVKSGIRALSDFGLLHP
jgi:hypothetical protein